MSVIKQLARKLVPSSRIREGLQNLHESYLIASAPVRNRRAVRRLSGKSKITVAFFIIHGSAWKSDDLYKSLAKDERFDPIIIICPYNAFNGALTKSWMNDSYDLFAEKQYNVVKTYNEATGKWLDVKGEVRPDIVFFTNPHRVTSKEYLITNYLNYLTCYVPYTFQVSNLYSLQYDQLFHNLLWRAFYQTPLHKEMAFGYARNKGRNVVVSGYPGIDVFMDKSYAPSDPWKIKDPNCKRIIWAPHHTIGSDSSGLSYSNFLKYHQFMLNMAEKYSDRIQIAFKPHPMLKPKLNSEKDWGEEKASCYYLKWKNMHNGQLEEYDYVDLFLTSDAMIHDSASFMAEYLAVNKPVLYTVHDFNITDRLNQFGRIALDQHYQAHSEEDIIDFIEETILNGNDPKKEQREAFNKKYMVISEGFSATNNIFNEIKKEILI